MKRFKHLLVHLDLQGPHDRSAVRYASAVSRLGRSQRVEFIHTGPAPTFFGGTLNDSPARTAAWLRQANAEVEQLVHRHFRGPPGCRVQVQVLGGAGFHDLLDRLRQGDTDLILVGKSEANGAFVEKLARKAPCSVMVVPSGRSVAYRRILVTTDFSDHSARAIEVAAAFAKARKLKQLCCFHGYQIPYGQHKTGIPRERLEKEWLCRVRKSASGLTILHGPPGTGKTSFLRALMNRLLSSTVFYYVPISEAEMLSSPRFVIDIRISNAILKRQPERSCLYETSWIAWDVGRASSPDHRFPQAKSFPA